MAGVCNGARGVVCLALVLCGCGREELVAASACDDSAPGDLVITEVHANPDGADDDGEYIELFNPSNASLPLDGLTLASSRSSGTGAKAHLFFGASVPAGGYLVVGNAPLDSMPPHVDYSYGSTLGSLRNSDATVAVRCGEVLIDQMSYDRTVDGRALEFDGRLAPDHELNDLASHWCESPEGVDEVSPGNFGTPGALNSPCALEEPVGGCLEAGLRRAIDPPEPGELRLTEWMANPRGPDTDFEWVEALFLAEADLNGFELGAAPDALKVVIDQEECFPVDAGARVVFGASPAAAPRVDAELKLSLGNSGARSIVAAVDGVVLDRVDYEGTVEGIAWQVDSNDEVCLALPQDEYLTDNFGTPGDPNSNCPPVLGPGMCFDDGTPREIISPGPGEVSITEWMANPSSVDNRDGEWVEVQFEAAVDLNGLLVSDLTSSGTTVEDEGCLEVDAGAHLIFARNANPLENGGVQGVDAELGLTLNNSDETIRLSVGDQILGSVSYQRSSAGVATQVDELGSICDATQVYGDGDLGTPGLANPRCF